MLMNLEIPDPVRLATRRQSIGATLRCLPSFVVLLSTMTGCASVTPYAGDETEPPPLPSAVTARFCYPRAPINADLQLIDQKKHFNVLYGSFESGLPDDDDPSPITFEYYELPDVDNAPVAVVLTILNGQKDLVRPFARYFARHGYASIIVDTTQRKTLAMDLLEPDKAIRQSVQRNRRMLDWVTEQRGLDASRIVVFGASLGGFNAMYLSAIDGRIAAVVPALAASDLPYVFANSTERRVKAAVDRVLEERRISADELEGHLRENIDTSILDLAPYIDPARVQMIIARFDKAVPTVKQRELRDALREPETILLPTGHIASAVYIPFLRKRALRFFNRALEEDPGGRTVRHADSDCFSLAAEGAAEPRIATGN